MKYVIILGDGMADLPVKELGGKTPLMCADKKNIDALAKFSEIGLMKTVPDSLSPGSDTANLSVMGYDPEIYYSGRSPLEAVSMGVTLDENDSAFRCNLVTLSDEENYSDKTMLDYSSGEITTKESGELITFIKQHIETDIIKLYKGISYRHCLKWQGLKNDVQCTPPHDISDKKISGFLPKGAEGKFLTAIMEKSYKLLSSHPVNIKRVKRGLNAANSLWLWGQGYKPSLKPFKELYGLDGAVISAVDLVKGIGICAGMKIINVVGATGNLDTNYKGKADAAIKALQGCDFVYLHIEAPDECGHRQQVYNKIRAIEFIDKIIVKRVLSGLKKLNQPFTMLITPDHPTPLSTRTHSREPVPYLLFRSNKPQDNKFSYDEQGAKQSGNYIDKGHTIINKMITEQ
ncbi:MAG: cofactor-independent phosphoglycerate mutase [Clostridia bacterium]|nr:cofactor-independent phosphoglycerate mutase [Clostridia bacterium]